MRIAVTFLYPSGQYDSADRLLSFHRRLLHGGGQGPPRRRRGHYG
ncbi:MAG TPA: hypothetical protein VGI81_13255 [Tepidisphaeraceae bacterium]